MKKAMVLSLVLLFVSSLSAGQLTIEGTYTTSYKSKVPNYTFKGTLSSTGETEYEGEITAPWDGQNKTYKGKITGKPGSGSLEGSFILTGTKRNFTFTIDQNGRGDALENGKKVGVLDAKVSGGGSAASSAPAGGVVDFSDQVSEAVSKETSISREKVLELFKNKGVTKADVIAVCAAAEITKGDLEALYKKKKKVNTTFEFLYDLKLDKEAKTGVDSLIKKIKAALEEKNKKK